MSVKSVAATIETQNVVVSTSIDQELDLETVDSELARSSYDPDTFPAIQYPLKQPEVTVLLYRSGAVIGTGADSIDQARTAVEKTYEDLESLGITTTSDEAIEVENIVSTTDLDQRLNLNALAIGLGLEHVEYDPAQFPGLIYRLPDKRAVILLFGSGQVVITGCIKSTHCRDAINQLVDQLSDLELLDDLSNQAQLEQEGREI
jgi:transcription initiation factor TFIID TATA-box-binding protein